MKFDLENLNPGIWFTHDEGGKIQVRAIPLEALKKIERQTTKKRVEYKRGQRLEYTDVDDEKQNELIWDYCIISWKNIEDDNGKPIECTKKNKIDLMNKSVVFATWVAESIEIAAESYHRAKEKSEKN